MKFSQQQKIVRYYQVTWSLELNCKKCSWSNLLRNQQLCCMSLYDHSSIMITIEMPDFDCLHRQFQTRLSHLLYRAPPSAGWAATSNPLRCLSPVLPKPNACCRKAGGRSARPAARRAATGYPQWLVHWAAARSTTVLPPQRISGRSMVLPATRPPPTMGPRNTAWFAQFFLPLS